VHDSLIEPLRANQVRLSWQPAIRDSKRYQDAETKIKEFDSMWFVFKDNFNYPDKILSVIQKIHNTRMTQFLEKGNLMSPEESEELKTVLEPYIGLLAPFEEIKRLQAAMLSHGKLIKLTLPYDEVNASLKEMSELAAKMPKILMDGVVNLSQDMVA
jgi:hypothetical protein